MFSLVIGESTPILQNTVYGLPTKLCYVSSNVAIESSQDGTTFAALTGANTTGVNCGGKFVRCTTAGGAVVTCKEF